MGLGGGEVADGEDDGYGGGVGGAPQDEGAAEVFLVGGGAFLLFVIFVGGSGFVVFKQDPYCYGYEQGFVGEDVAADGATGGECHSGGAHEGPHCPPT